MPWVLWHECPDQGGYLQHIPELCKLWAGPWAVVPSPRLSPVPRCQLSSQQAEGLWVHGTGQLQAGSGGHNWRQPRAAFGFTARGPSPDQGGVSPLRAGARGAGLAPQPPAVPQPTLCCHPGGAGSIPAEPVACPGTSRCHTAHRTTINRSAGRCVGGCPLAAQPLLQVSPFFSLLHPAICPAPAAGARRALSRRRRHRGRFHPVNGFPVMFNHHQRWRRCLPLALLPHRTLQRQPARLLGSTDAHIHGCQHGLLAWC